MKICWDNLEKITKINKSGNFCIGTAIYIEADSCKNCGESYLRVKTRTNELFCSNSCARSGKYNSFYRKKHTEDNLQIMKDVNYKENHHGWGKHLTKEHKEKISQSTIGKSKNKSELNANWNPDKSFNERIKNRKYFKYTEWRKQVFKNDNWTCQKCKKKGRLNAHHILSYSDNPGSRIDPENGITFCTICHNNFHHLFGYGKNNIDQLKEFLCKKYL